MPLVSMERSELKRKLYRAVANVNILEGIRFYASLACSFAFGENKLMEGSAKILLLLLEMKVNIWFSRRISSTNGETETMQKCRELLEEEEYVKEMFQTTVNEEKTWADYLFKRRFYDRS